MDLRNPITAAIPSLDGPVLEVLARTTRPLTGREVWRLAEHGSDNGVRAVLARMVKQGVVLAEPRETATFYTANRRHLAWPAIEILAGLRREMLSQIRSDIRKWRIRPAHASVFGSAARADGDKESDIDVLLIRPDRLDVDAWQAQKQLLSNAIHQWTGNDAQLFDVDRTRLAQHVVANDPLVDAWLREGIHLTGRRLGTLIREAQS